VTIAGLQGSRWPGLAVLLALQSALSACTTPEPPPAPPPTALADLLERPAERALHEALRAYDDAQYPAAEAALQNALRAGLRNPRDQALAHKLMAFITCTSERLVACEAAFRAARAADASFALSRAESGHPVWGPVYLRTLQP
jgi:Tfp pilus assembly protein PilF